MQSTVAIAYRKPFCGCARAATHACLWRPNGCHDTCSLNACENAQLFCDMPVSRRASALVEQDFLAEDHKTCPTCKDTLPPTFFGRSTTRKCHSCRSKDQGTLKTVAPVSEKLCKCCHVVLPASMFAKMAKSPTGLSSQCKVCTKQRLRSRLLKIRLNPVPFPQALQRRCTRCLEVRSFDQFHRSYAFRDGLANFCKVCSSASYKHRKGLA